MGLDIDHELQQSFSGQQIPLVSGRPLSGDGPVEE